MNIAVIGTSKKENEKRVPVHPMHIPLIPKRIRQCLFFQKGYGVPFGVSDQRIHALTGNPVMDRDELMCTSGTIIITKPVLDDFPCMKEGATVWGWIHSVRQPDIVQIAIDKKMTLIAWENMYHHSIRERVHIFYKNNEMAGYCGVQHALQLRGIDGNFGPPRKVCILSMGSVSKGAIYAFIGHGFSDITVYTRRPSFLAGHKLPGIRYKQLVMNENNGGYQVVNFKRERRPLIEEMTNADIIVNGMLQDPQNPAVFIHGHDIPKFQKECLIIDISCDIGMGFSFARPTDFSNPVLRFGNILYYAVDHTPTLLWDSASWEISNGILPYLAHLAEQTYNEVLQDAMDIKEGKILNGDIIACQNRTQNYPHNPIQ